MFKVKSCDLKVNDTSKLEITICDFKFGKQRVWRKKKFTVCFYRARDSNALIGFKK
ncbi:hypothetical protein BRYFOR_09162 [Marvinbryantia formatexigens DSM 14469]|uniref:Uncharacterized protein n=1 Tax=Marvinbryantia formatexigens DSM 14469 TaxID=478749 RepID=C6LKH5_9FIRM|nr:hypothetical protein BRYFOR_09162 [Marvinbryantia formatexigens DSM 14469]